MVRSRRLAYLVSLTVIAGAILASLAAPAAASTAQLVELSSAPACKYFPPPECFEPPPDTALVYLGGGETNRVGLTADAQQVRITDPGAQVVPGPGCSPIDGHNVSCSVPSALVYVATGAGADAVRSELGPTTKLTVDGGAGKDLLVGGLGPDALLGGRGADRLRGRAGDDRLFDASSPEPLRAGDLSPREGGSDVFFDQNREQAALPPGRGRDSFDGGSGRDTLSYVGRSDKLRIDLASRKPVSGARRERDSIRRMENAIGGRGDDRIGGNRRANRLEGDGTLPGELPARGGNDRIAGRAGADSIAGGDGRNMLSGGAGDDSIGALAGRRNRVSCGPGTDFVGDVSPKVFLAPDCEKPGFDFLDALLGGPLDVRSLLPLRKGRPPRILTGSLGCFLDFVCEVRAEVRVRGRASRHGTSPPRGTLLGSTAFMVGANEIKPLDLRLSRSGLRRLRRHRALRVSVSLGTQHSDGGPSTYVTLLRAPQRSSR